MDINHEYQDSKSIISHTHQNCHLNDMFFASKCTGDGDMKNIINETQTQINQSKWILYLY